jgi:hypothetical protein
VTMLGIQPEPYGGCQAFKPLECADLSALCASESDKDLPGSQSTLDIALYKKSATGREKRGGQTY